MNQVKDLLSAISPMDVRAELFRKRDFEFIVSGYNEKGDWVTHEKQREALLALTSGDYDEILYGGAAGGAKTYTGCVWILFMAYLYPNTRWFIARNQLKDILDSVLVTFEDVCAKYGFHDYKFNAVKNWIDFANGSRIDFVEIKRKPRDLMYEYLGSKEYTGGWIEEVGEIDERGATVLGSRAGRYKNSQYGIRGTVLYTCNPKQNWAKEEFYVKHKNGTLEEEKCYLQCLVTQNPFIPAQYIKNLKRLARKDKAIHERLFKGNWEYEDNPYQLAEQEMIEQVFDNDHLMEQLAWKRYLTVDAARFGSDKARLAVWYGWVVVEMMQFDTSATTEIEAAIMHLRKKHKIPRNRSAVDADGVGGGVADGSKIRSFYNNAKPIREKGLRKQPNYRNLQTQCLYHLADIINEGLFWIKADVSVDDKIKIKQELAQIQRKGDFEPDRKLECKSKEDIKSDIGRSPDFRDVFLIRVWFDLKKFTTKLATTWR